MITTRKIAGFALLLSLAACQSASTVNPLTEAKKVSIAPPIAGLDIAFQTFEADADKDNEWKLPNGTTISIPAHSLTGADGKPLTGKVAMRYREMHDAVDVLLSGIPMNYNAKGKNRTMQTAGMFELRGEQAGSPIAIAPNAGITVKMASYETGTDYNFFYLDENKGWEFLDYVAPEINANKTKSTVKKPEMAFPLGKEYFCFSYAGLLDVMFEKDLSQVTDENLKNPIFGEKARKYGLTWLNVFGHQNGIEFEGVKYPSSLLVWKRLSAKDFPDWFKKDGKYAGYEFKPIRKNVYELSSESEDGSQKFTAQVEVVMPLKALLKFPAEYWEKNYEEGMAKVRAEQERLKTQADAFRTFEVSGFGIYNYDKLMNEQDMIQVTADFQVEKQGSELYELDFVFYLPQDNKTVVKLPKNDWAKVALLPNNAARFITILPDGAIGLYAAQDYLQIDFEALRKQEKPQQRFDLVKKIDKLDSAKQLKELLGV